MAPENRNRTIRTMEDALSLLDHLFTPQADHSWWDDFYADRSRPVPFFVAKPDENLVSYLDRGLVSPSRALDLGCGPGRNALYLAARGFEVDAVDLSPAAVAWAEERAREAEADIRFFLGDAFAPEGAHSHGHEEAQGGVPEAVLDGPYDLIHDSGCFHHLAPHRRVSYLAFLDRVLAPGGHLALTCFASGADRSGSDLPDEAFYQASAPHGGIAYTPESLRWIFSDLTEVESRRMRDEPEDSPNFGEPFLWTALFRKELPGERA